MFFENSVISITTAHIFFGLLSFIVYRSLSIEDAKKYKHLDFLMIVLLGLFTFESMEQITSLIKNPGVLIYLLLSVLIGFIFALVERLYYHRIVGFGISIFSKIHLDSIDLDTNNFVLQKLLDRIYGALYVNKKNKVPIEAVWLEITFKNAPQKVTGYLLGYSLKDINLAIPEDDNVVIANISLRDVNMIKLITTEEYAHKIY